MLMFLPWFNTMMSSFLMILAILSGVWSTILLSLHKSMFFMWTLASVNSGSVEVSLILDPLSMLFMFSVSVIASSVMCFSNSYMDSEIFFLRFHLLVVMFVFSMMLLILSPNLMSILLGWDGLGVTSYLLVIYYQSNKSYNAGMLTALSNRVGDVFILILISFMLSEGSWNFWVYSQESTLSTPSEFAMLVILASITKSAQIPFSAWLPAAMAAPTPVSALVHSSTLVTAGVYLLIRFFNFLSLNSHLWLILFLGSITMVMAGVTAMFETDMKKMVALSTLSQLGLMMSCLGLGTPSVAFFHLLSHAYFKALLFMCAGNMIHSSNDYQDLRTMGAMSSYLPVTNTFLNLSNFSLCGLPFMSGFYSKDMILETALMSSVPLFSIIMFYLATLLTAAYSMRLYILTSARMSNSFSTLWLSDEDRVITSGCWILAPLAVMGGCYLSWVIFLTPPYLVLPTNFKLMAIYVTLAGALLGVYGIQVNYPSILVNAFALMWFLPQISGRLISSVSLNLGYVWWSKFDNLWANFFYHSKFLENFIFTSGFITPPVLSKFYMTFRPLLIWTFFFLVLALIISL